MPKKTDCINFIPPTGKDCELCRIRNDWCVPCETCEQYESFASWLNKKHKNSPPKEDLTMYESPITIVTQKLRKAISERYDDYIMATVEESLGCDVNKEELIKALNYDRNQYDKGFRDGYGMEHIPSPITRGDLIRRMTDEELANEIYGWVLMYMPPHLRDYSEATRRSILDKLRQELK